MTEKKPGLQTERHTSAGADSTQPRSASYTATEPDAVAASREIGGRKGPDPARYGDWEKQGRCIDF